MVKIPVTELRRPRLGYSAIDRSWLLEQPPLGRGSPFLRITGSPPARSPSPHKQNGVPPLRNRLGKAAPITGQP